MAMSRAAFYGVPQLGAEYYRRADKEILCCAIFENREVLGELDAAVGVADLDVVLIGPGDLSLEMSSPRSDSSGCWSTGPFVMGCPAWRSDPRYARCSAWIRSRVSFSY